MGYEKFNILNSSAVPLPIENVDTDQIIPARFLKATERKGFGDNLFRDWRFFNDNRPKKDFILNNKNFGGKILVAGRNFGSGSSREHAAWAIYDYGFRCVVSSFFADIFRNNCLNIGVLPVQISDNFLKEIFITIEKNPNSKFKIDLPKQEILNISNNKIQNFNISLFKKENLLNGYDDIDYLTSIRNDITTFAKKLPL